MDDRSAEQLTLIMRNAQATLKVAHGKAWHDMMGTVIERLENGRLGSVDTAHIKSVVEDQRTPKGGKGANCYASST